MAIQQQYDPPGGLTDLDDTGLAEWSDWVSGTVDAACIGPQNHTNDRPRAQYYNLTKKDTAPDAKLQDVSWIAFPKVIKGGSSSDDARWATADGSRDVQDEYCEWSVDRRPDGKIIRVTFTCEGGKYWEVLAKHAPNSVVQLYRDHVNPAVRPEDLFDGNHNYIARNKWNSDTKQGVMHLIQPNNTLDAEIELAAAATIVRVIKNKELTGEQELIACSKYGEARRNSDPHIGGVVNGVARLKADVTLSNPVGLYFDGLSTEGWITPDGSKPESYWTYRRGGPKTPVRAVYEVPAEKGFVVGDITIGGQKIIYGAQIADFISIKLTAIACRFGQSAAGAMNGCVADVPGAAPANFVSRAGLLQLAQLPT